MASEVMKDPKMPDFDFQQFCDHKGGTVGLRDQGVREIGADIVSGVFCTYPDELPQSSAVEQPSQAQTNPATDPTPPVAKSRASAPSAVATLDECGAYRTEVESCRSITTEAEESTCNYKNNKDTSGFIGMADGMTKVLTSNTTSSIQAACSQMGKISQMANAAMLAFKSSCQVAQSDCTEQCGRAANLKKLNPALAACESGQVDAELASAKRSCARFAGNIADAQSQMASMYSTQVKSSQCDQLTAAGLQQHCLSAPNDPLCAIAGAADCNNPAFAAKNLICICKNNPRDPACGSSTSASTSTASMEKSSNASALASAKANGASVNALTGYPGSDGYNPEDLSRPGSSPGSGPGSGAKGVGRNISGGGDSSSPSGAKPAAAGHSGLAATTKVLGGYYGGSSSGFGAGSAGSTGASSSGGGNYAVSSSASGQQPGVDLKQFLPGGGRDPSRGIAGISGPDGITGPNSDIWAKVNTRYRTVTPSMKP